jgi:hypothetical protein
MFFNPANQVLPKAPYFWQSCVAGPPSLSTVAFFVAQIWPRPYGSCGLALATPPHPPPPPILYIYNIKCN